ncbi:MAG: DUF1508 domain-containing protein [Candidatus Moranbacteria bacterium]|nr:DUF1508 domain-containing protein [Candidatus Moranbacteria bacterium]
MTKFEIFRDRAGEYRWRLIARNGQIVAASEGYTTKYSALRSAETIKALAVYAIIVEKL